ncbi:MAG: methyl-accepting chemotaxis protein [bacterium]|nr:methyl-accepting chemotaxis protein [bacterium]
MMPEKKLKLALALPDLLSLFFGVPFLMYFVSRVAAFPPQANRVMLWAGIPISLLLAALTQVWNRKRMRSVTLFLSSPLPDPQTATAAFKSALDFPLVSAVHMAVNFLVAVPVIWLIVALLAQAANFWYILLYSVVTALVLGALIFLAEEFLLKDIVSRLAILHLGRQSEVIKRTFRISLTYRLISLFLVVMLLSLSFGVMMGRLNQLTLVALIGLAATVIIAYLASRNITGVIDSLVQALSEISGDNRGLGRHLPLLANNELGDLCHQYNQFVDLLDRLVTDIEKVAAEVAASAQELASSSQQMNASGQEISSTIQQISKGATVQSERLTSVAKSLQDFSEAAKRIDSQVRMTTVSSQRAVDSSQQGAAKTSEAVLKIAEIYQSADQTSQKVVKLQQKSKEIGGVAALVSNLAQQIDFLALNAAIEAARAGEAGKGFSVVADEIRSLAVEAGNSAQQASSLIRDIEAEIAKTVEVIAQTQQSIENSRTSVDQTEQALKVINSTVTVAGTMVKQISESSRAQTKSAGQVVQLASEVSAIAIETAASTEEVAAAVEQQTASMEELSAVAQTLSHTAVKMNSLVARFKSTKQ